MCDTLGEYKAAVIGLGVVGKAQVRLFGGMVRAVYDPAVTEGPYPFDAVAGCDFAVIAVGTPQGEDGSADLSQLREALDRIPPEVPVLIRSTLPPGTMAELERSRSCVAYLPEFLNERDDGPWRESIDVPFMILGGLPAARDFFFRVLGPVIEVPLYEHTGLEAELIKYTANLFLATKVTFVNEIARICAAFGADWERVREGWQRDPRAGQSHSHVEGPGFAGRCFPKDLSALICASEKAGYVPTFLEAVQVANIWFRSETAGAGA